MESTRCLQEVTFTNSLKHNAVVCLLTRLMAPYRSEQLSADGDENCWKHRGRGAHMYVESLQGIYGDILTSVVNMNAPSGKICVF